MTTGSSRSRLSAAFGVFVGFAACGGGSGSGAAPPKGSDMTNVTVTRDPNAKPNAFCQRYCDRVAECWLELPNADPMIAPADAKRRCLSEQNQCQKPTTAAHCCGAVKDCLDFAHCYESGSDVPSDCSR